MELKLKKNDAVLFFLQRKPRADGLPEIGRELPGQLLQADLEFGNENMLRPGQARRQLGNPVNKLSPWDALHPGSECADATTDNQKPPATIIEQIGAHLATHRPYANIHRSSSASPKTCAN